MTTSLIRFLYPLSGAHPSWILIGVVFLISIIASANTSRGAEGTLNSVAFHTIPNGATLAIESLDDSDDSTKLINAFKAAIKNAGYAPSDRGTLLMIFEARKDIGGFSTRNRRHILSIKTTGGRLGGGQDSIAQLNVFDSNTGGLLNRGRGTTTITTPGTFNIDVTIEDRGSGKILWQGWGSTELTNNVGIEYTQQMIPSIVKAIGKTVRQENFSLY